MSVIEKKMEIYSGKAKTLYATSDPDLAIMTFRDDTSAFDGIKVAKLANKGQINNQFNAFIMEHLHQAKIPVHFEKLLSEQDCLVKRLKMFKVECVLRYFAAGSMCRRFGIPEGQPFSQPTYELFLKDDALHDPMINESLAINFNLAQSDELKQMKEYSFAIAEVLKPLFLQASLLLVDFKLEFGFQKGKIFLGDEFTPDGCRIWDKESKEKLDKDRFRKDLGQVVESYQLVAQRLGIF